MKSIKSISLFLGVSMFMFGFLKFFNPFKGWYSVQISASDLSPLSYVLGILGELAVGLAFLGAILFVQRLSFRMFFIAILGASLVVVVMMITGIYVHLHPAVPADVLPLKIKPPFIPAFFMGMGILNFILMIGQYRKLSAAA